MPHSPAACWCAVWDMGFEIQHNNKACVIASARVGTLSQNGYGEHRDQSAHSESMWQKPLAQMHKLSLLEGIRASARPACTHLAGQKRESGPRRVPEKKWLVVAQVRLCQRSLLAAQAHFPSTEHTAGFCLLCCQPEPMPLSSSTRISQFPLGYPCRVRTWSGQALNAVSRT